MRGLFSVHALTQLEERAKAPIIDYFNVFAGTSIGGIIAIAVALGIRPAHIEAAIRKHGPKIFTKSRWRFADPWMLFHTPYAQEPLQAAIVEIMGGKAQMQLKDIEVPLIVPAVDFIRSSPRIFASPPLAAPGEDLSISILDVALATSAAPTFLPPHRVGKHVYVDGGLIANAPDMIAAERCVARLHVPLDSIRTLSVGTATPEVSLERGNLTPGRKAWLLNHDLFGTVIDSQSRLSIEVAQARLRERFYRLDYPTTRPIPIDSTSDDSFNELITAADEAVKRLKSDAKMWGRFFVNLMPPTSSKSAPGPANAH